MFQRPVLGIARHLGDRGARPADVDAARIKHCSFYVATRDGAVSMCEHNARRDDYIIPANLVRGVDIKPSRPPIAAVSRDAEHRPIK